MSEGRSGRDGATREDDALIVAAAYQAYRIRRAAGSVAGWALTYLKHRKRSRTRNVAAREFAEAAVTLAATLIWNEIAFGPGGWLSRATAGSALAHDLVLEMPEAYSLAARLHERKSLPFEQAEAMAQRYATLQTARVCRDIVRLIPDLFAGIEGPSHLEKARQAWREFHCVSTPPPASAEERLAAGLGRLGATSRGEKMREGDPRCELPPDDELPDRLINLDQASALVNKTPHGLRHYRGRGMPAPRVKGTKGKPNQYSLAEMLPWLEKTFHPIPKGMFEHFLRNRRF